MLPEYQRRDGSYDWTAFKADCEDDQELRVTEILQHCLSLMQQQ
jgi:hypothetical protein